MDTEQLNEKWPALKSKIEKQHPELTREDLLLEIGKEEELLLRLQQKLGKNRKDIDNWLSLLG